MDVLPQEYFRSCSNHSSISVKLMTSLDRIHNGKIYGHVISFRYELTIGTLCTAKLHYHSFKVGEVLWRLCIFPYGVNSTHSNFISIYLVAPEIKNRFTDTWFTFDYSSNEFYKYSFSSVKRSCGVARWQKKVPSNIVNIHGYFALVVRFNVKEYMNAKQDIFFMDPYHQISPTAFKEPFDLKLECFPGCLYFHSKELVTRSSFIASALSQVSRKTQEVCVIDMSDVSENIIWAYLTYLHSGHLRLKNELFKSLCSFAVNYRFLDLQLVCEFELIYFHLNKDNVPEHLKLACLCDMKLLKIFCLQHIEKCFSSVMVSPEWIEVISMPTAILDITKHLATKTKYKRCLKDKQANLFPLNIADYPPLPVLNCSKTFLQIHHDFKVNNSVLIAKCEITIDDSNEYTSSFLQFKMEKNIWTLQIWTNGINEASEEFISIYLFLNSTLDKDQCVYANFTFNYPDDEAYYHCFTNRNSNWGLSKWKERHCFSGKVLLLNFALTLSDSNTKEKNNNGTDLSHIICHRFNETLLYNFFNPYDTLLVGDKWEYNAHRDILKGHSPIFFAMFNSETSENLTKKVYIKDIESDIMKSLLLFMYTKQLDVDKDNVLALCIVAEKYLIDSLKLACENVLSCHLNVENVSDLLIASSMHRLSFLKEKCFYFIQKHFDLITQTVSWKRLAIQTAEMKALLSKLIEIGEFNPI